ncbi:hypothetical protein [Maricaulis sp.]|uniref:hypothetical protein n=1 Tax=Maricaulis sp. TaxID=1486257 RepID=UPI002B27A6EA|nr:hypothetical protein [Maricaulis sp.]
MILRRLMRHMSDQNWVAVGLDFVIVVVGVAVGFQLTGYYDETQRRATEATYLDGISSDYEIYQELLLCRIDGEAAIADGLIDLIGDIDGHAPDAAQRAAIIGVLPMSHAIQPGLVMEGNTSALVGGDLVAMISDAGLRGRILAAQSIGTSSVGTLAQIERAYLTIDRFDRFTTREWHAGIGYFIATDYDVDAMREAPGLRDDLMDLVNLHRSASLSNRILLDAVEGVLDRLVELDVREAPAAPVTCPYDMTIRTTEP